MSGARRTCDLCGADLTRPDDADYFDEAAYRVTLLPPGQQHQGRRYLITCPGPCRRGNP